MIVHDINVRSLDVTIDDTNIDGDVHNVHGGKFNNIQLNLTMTSGDYGLSKVMST